MRGDAKMTSWEKDLPQTSGHSNNNSTRKRWEEERSERACDDIALRVRDREERECRARKRTTPLLKGLTWKKEPWHIREDTHSDAPKHNQTAHDPAWMSVWYTDTHKQNTVHALTAALKIKTNQCLMLQILGVRKEGSGRIERERVTERTRKGEGWLSESWLVVTQFSLLSICYGCTGQECTGGEGKNWG